MRLRESFLIVFFGLLGLFSKSQNLPKIIPPSPTAMQFQKYGDYPVGHFTGVPEINIPLYTIIEGDIEFPISLSYHASGIKPTDPNGFVGLGWVLNAGGRISRTVMDIPDEEKALPNPFYTSQELLNGNTEFRTNYLIPLGYLDNEPDVFSYNFGQNNGKFVLKWDQQRTPVLFPYKPLKVSTTVATGFWMGPFDIFDEKGFQYRFGSSIDGTVSAVENSDLSSAPTSWLLTDVVSPIDRTNHIKIKYETGPTEKYSQKTDQFIADDNFSSYSIYRPCYPGAPQQTGGSQSVSNLAQYFFPATELGYKVINYFGEVISEVDFKSGKIKFISNVASKMLDRIEVYDLKNQLIKSIVFTISSLTSQRKFLKEVRFLDSNGQMINKYSFGYHGEVGFTQMPEMGEDIDFWGYYKGSLGSGNLLPNWQIFLERLGGTTRNVGFNSRETDGESMKYYVLEQINYPTGGHSFFDFEPNRSPGYVAAGYNSNFVGGLRIKSITNYTDANTIANKKTYKYGTSVMDVHPERANFSYSQEACLFALPSDAGGYDVFRRRYYSSDPLIDLAPQGSPVLYPFVEEFLGDEQNNVGKIEYNYEFVPTEYENYTTNGAVDGQVGATILYKPFMKYIKPWVSGQLLSKIEYKKVGMAYDQVHSITNVYEEVIRENVRGFHLEPFVFYESDNCGHSYSSDNDYYTSAVYRYLNTSYWNFADYYIVSGEKRIQSTVENQDGVETETSYIYNENGFVVAKTKKNSKDEIIKTEYKYPSNFIGQEPYNEMVSRHILNPLVEEIQSKSNNTHLKSNKTTYNFWYNNSWGTNNPASIIVPQMVDVKTLGTDYETRLRYHAYDNYGNISSVSKENGAETSYIWDYQHNFPIAEVTNIISQGLAYTSFESDGLGGWSIPYSGRDLNSSITGTQSYDILDHPITKGDLFYGVTYIMSYWSKSGPCSISGTNVETTKAGQTINGWTYYAHQIYSGTSISISISGSGLIDELRLYPKGAQMTTFTYDPLIGVTSKCDVNNDITYFEYDNFSRLKNIRDKERNILKHYQYEIANSIDPNIAILHMENFAGNNTIGYPVGVFNVNGKLIGHDNPNNLLNATNNSSYVTIWNSDPDNQLLGTLTVTGDPMKFELTLNPSKNAPASVIGCRYYQFDITYDKIDGIRNLNGCYVDFGDGSYMRLGKYLNDVTGIVPSANTHIGYINRVYNDPLLPYFIHEYPDYSTSNPVTHTITCYHTDTWESPNLDNSIPDLTELSLTLVKNLRGNFPQFMNTIGGSCYQQSSFNSVSQVLNWNSINSVKVFKCNLGDAYLADNHPHMNLAYPQDFLQNNKGLEQILTSYGNYWQAGYRDANFKLSRLKSDWNTYFSNINNIAISDEHWDREDLTGLSKLRSFYIAAGNTLHSNNPSGNTIIPIPTATINEIIKDIAANSGKNVANGIINIDSGGQTRDQDSDAAVGSLKSNGWTIIINGAYQ